jgi:hypothetical protein
MTVDTHNAFVQMYIIKIIMNIKVPLVDMLIDIEPDVFESYIIEEDNEKMVYVHVMKSIYGMLQALLLFYKKLRKDLEEIGSKINPYDTITSYIDDLRSSHKDSKVNDGNDERGNVRAMALAKLS